MGIIGTYAICRKFNKVTLHIKAVTMIDTIMGWFGITQYNNKNVITITNLVETTWLTRYPWPNENTYDQVLEFIGHEFIKYLFEE